MRGIDLDRRLAALDHFVLSDPLRHWARAVQEYRKAGQLEEFLSFMWGWARSHKGKGPYTWEIRDDRVVIAVEVGHMRPAYGMGRHGPGYPSKASALISVLTLLGPDVTIDHVVDLPGDNGVTFHLRMRRTG